MVKAKAAAVSEWQMIQACLTIMAVALDIWLTVIVMVVLWLLRRQCCFECRRDVRKLIGKAIKADIYSGRDWRWRWEAFEAVSYHRMMLRFWKLADSFWSEKIWEIV